MNLKRAGHLPAYLALTIITLFAGLALGATYNLTQARIAAQADLAADKARARAFPEAEAFVALTVPEGAGLDWCFEARKGESAIGHVAQTTVDGFGGKIEVIAGIDASGAIAGVSVGGSGFSETAGLGAKAKDSAFTDQFLQKIAPTRVVKAGEAKAADTVDAITSATVTSRAVNGGVNAIASYINQLKGGAPLDAETHATQEAEKAATPSDAETHATQEAEKAATPSDAETHATQEDEKAATPSDAETHATQEDEKAATPSDATTGATVKHGKEGAK